MSNGDDGYKLVKGTEESYTVVDTLGDFMGDPGSGWDICGVASGTQDHTLVKKEGKEGNADWTSSRGTTADDCDWIVAEKDAFMLTAGMVLDHIVMILLTTQYHLLHLLHLVLQKTQQLLEL